MTVAVFDEFSTGDNNPESGLYLCKGCGEIIPLSKDETFPPCTDCGSATWMMVAIAGEAGRSTELEGIALNQGFSFVQTASTR